MGTASNSRSERSAGADAAGALARWGFAVAACTLFLWFFRDRAHEAQKALAYLLIVLGASSRHGRVVGLSLAVVSFLAFNFFLLEPYYTLAVEDPLDWWVLVAFLATGVVAAQLFHQTRRARALAEDRAREVERLSTLGAESLSVPRAVDAVAAIVRVIQSELSAGLVRVVAFEGDAPAPRVLASEPGDARTQPLPEGIETLVQGGRIVTVAGGASPAAFPPEADLGAVLESNPGAEAVFIPLRVRERLLGVLQVERRDGLHLDGNQAFFAGTLSHFAALAVERVGLSAEVEHVEALREADRLKDALLASVSHDLRTPLTTIRALASELRSTGDERSVIIEEEAERLNEFVTDLLDFSRIRSGAVPMEPGLTAAEDLVGAALQRLQGVPGSERIQVRLPPGDLLVGRFDFVHSLRILGNLLENALRHTPPGTPVELDVAREGDTLLFQVLDRGAGIPHEDRERIFEPFFHASGSSDHAGTGLGLAIARTMALAQGGTVTYRPRAGGGSVFEFRLPAEDLESLP